MSKYTKSSDKKQDAKTTKGLDKEEKVMCSTCGCGKPKDKHGMKTLTAANKKYDKKSDSKGKAKKSNMVRKKGM